MCLFLNWSLLSSTKINFTLITLKWNKICFSHYWTINYIFITFHTKKFCSIYFLSQLALRCWNILTMLGQHEIYVFKYNYWVKIVYLVKVTNFKCWSIISRIDFKHWERQNVSPPISNPPTFPLLSITSHGCKSSSLRFCLELTTIISSNCNVMCPKNRDCFVI